MSNCNNPKCCHGKPENHDCWEYCYVCEACNDKLRKEMRNHIDQVCNDLIHDRRRDSIRYKEHEGKKTDEEKAHYWKERGL